MSTDNVFDLWQYAYVMPVFRTLGGPRRLVRGDVTTTLHDERVEWPTQWRPTAGVDYTDATLDLWAFELLGDDQWPRGAECPCDEVIEADSVGELLDAIRVHCSDKHPGALKVVWPK